MSPEKAIESRKTTRQMAVALVEDLEHFRSLLSQVDIRSAEIRRAAAQVRRLLIEGDISTVAQCRTGRVEILAPVIDGYVAESSRTQYRHFVTGGVPVCGTMLSHFVFQLGAKGPRSDFDDPANRRPVTLDRYLKQSALCFEGHWITRAAIVKYAANVASGVHSGQPKSKDDLALARMRNEFSLSRQGGAVITMPRAPEAQADFRHSPDSIDVVQYELLCTVHHVVNSPRVQHLEEVIHAELGAAN